MAKNTEENYTVTPSKNTTDYQSLCQEIFRQVNAPCMIAALLKFKHLACTYIQKAPIHHQNIFDHKDIYYGDFKLNFNDRYCFVVAMMADFSAISKTLSDQLGLILYNNPFDKKSALNIHTHGIILNKAVTDYAEIMPNLVTDTVHLYTENTVVSEVVFGKVFVVKEII